MQLTKQCFSEVLNLDQAAWLQHLYGKTYISVLPVARLPSMTEESGSKEATELSQKERELGTNNLVNEIFDDTLELYICEQKRCCFIPKSIWI